MNTVAQPEIIGLDALRDWLDLHCLSDDRRLRLPNTDEGHSKLEEIARFMAFRPEAGRRLPSGTLRVLRAPTTKRKQLVEMRKCHSMHCKADEKNGTACEFEDINADLREVLDRRIKDLEQRIKICLDSDGALAETAAVLRSVPGIGLVACAMLIAEMPELGQISGEQAASLAGLAPVARDSGQMRGKRMIGCGRRGSHTSSSPRPSPASSW